MTSSSCVTVGVIHNFRNKERASTTPWRTPVGTSRLITLFKKFDLWENIETGEIFELRHWKVYIRHRNRPDDLFVRKNWRIDISKGIAEKIKNIRIKKSGQGKVWNK